MPLAQRLDDALALIRAGASIIPCGADKRPLIAWRENHSSDETIVREWWRRFPSAIPGVVCGEPSRLWAVDLDRDRATGAPIGEEAAARLGIYPDDHPCAIRTPSGGWHLPYRWRPGLPRNTAGRVLGIDTRGDGGFLIAWDAPRLAAAIADPELPEPPLALLEALAPPAAPPPPPAPSGSIPEPYVRAAVDNECRAVALAREGTRNDTLNRAAFALGQLVGAGALSQQEAEARLIAAALTCGLDLAEARATIASGLRAGTQHPRAAPPPSPPTARHRAIAPATGLAMAQADRAAPAPAELPALPVLDPLPAEDAPLPPRRWIGGHGAFPHARLTAIAGPPGVTKTTFTISVACALALGLEYAGIGPDTPRRVLVACIEDDPNEVRRRTLGWMERFAPTADERDHLRQNLAILDLADHAPLIEVDADGIPTLSDGGTRFAATLAAHKPEIVFLDPLIELHTADENRAHLMRPVMRTLRHWASTYNVAIVIVHHETKAGEGNALQRLRGAGAIGGAIRSLLSLRHMTAEEAKKYNVPEDWGDLYIRIEMGKQQYARRARDRWLCIEEHDLSNGDRVPVLVPWTPPEAVVTPEMLAAALRAVAMGIDGEPLSLSPRSNVYFAIAFERAGVPKGACREVLAGLLRSGKVWAAPWIDPIQRKARKRLRCAGSAIEGWEDDE